jgi:hypothetical protein
VRQTAPIFTNLCFHSLIHDLFHSLIHDLDTELEAWQKYPIKNQRDRDDLFTRIDDQHQKISRTRFSFSPPREHDYLARFQRMKEYDRQGMKYTLRSPTDQDIGDMLTGMTLAAQQTPILQEMAVRKCAQGDVEAEKTPLAGTRFPLVVKEVSSSPTTVDDSQREEKTPCASHLWAKIPRLPERASHPRDPT